MYIYIYIRQFIVGFVVRGKIINRHFSKIAVNIATTLIFSEVITCSNVKISYIKSYINNCPTRCNTKQSIYYSASSLYMIRVSTTPIIRSTQNCNYSLRYCAVTSFQRRQVAMLEEGSCTKKYDQYRRL